LKRLAPKNEESGRHGVRPLPANIMVVDDDPFVREVVKTALSVSGVATVQTFDTGAAAIRAARDFTPGLVVLDLLMPGLDGRETWEALREILRPLPPVIFLTAHSDPESLGKVADLQPAGVISKPFDPSAIEQQIRRLLDGALDHAGAGRGRARIAGVKKDFQKSLGATAGDLEKLAARLKAGESMQAVVEALSNKAHTLAGTAGMFQLNTVGEAAAHVERLASNFVKAKTRAESEQDDARAELVAATEALQIECRMAMGVSH
tara:strand:- start:16 stop:804 length:789 start_codon:yes stop_codon:yes gene_type:complete